MSIKQINIIEKLYSSFTQLLIVLFKKRWYYTVHVVYFTGVIELYRNVGGGIFTLEDEEVSF